MVCACKDVAGLLLCGDSFVDLISVIIVFVMVSMLCAVWLGFMSNPKNSCGMDLSIFFRVSVIPCLSSFIL